MPIQSPVHPVLPPILGAYEVQLRKGLGDLNPDLPGDRVDFARVMTHLWRATRWEPLLEMADFLEFEDRNTHDRVVSDIACSWARKYAEAIKKAKTPKEVPVPDQPCLLPGSRQLELELYNGVEGFDLNDSVDRGSFTQRMLECWRAENYGRLRDAARRLDIEITPRTLHDELIKKIVGRWIQALLKHREKPRFDMGQRVMFRTGGVGTIPSHAIGSNETVEVVAEGGSHAGQVLVKGVYRAWIPVEDLLKF
jgi:hypothetical protein